jgi:hypothetical protein
MIVLPLLFACRPPSAAVPTGGSTWIVVAVSATPDRLVTSTSWLQVAQARADEATVSTVRAEGTWETPEGSGSWASDVIDDATPWPLRIQHAVAEVPAAFAWSDDGSPTRLIDPDGWREQVVVALAALELPTEALSTVTNVVDPDGLLRDLRRTFPGDPPPSGPWVREEGFGARVLTRTETCARAVDGGTVTWRCSGAIDGDGVSEGAATTSLVVDRRGLVEVESRWEALIAGVGPVGVRRLVVRE